MSVRVSRSFYRVTGPFIALLLAVCMVVPARAADEIQDSITLSPATKHLTLAAGETTQDSFTVINYGDVAYDFSVYSGPYSVKEETYTPDFIKQTPRGDAYKWVSFPEAKYHAEPKQRLTIPFSVRVSESAPSGSHYGVVFVETQPQGADTTGVARKKRLAMKLYVNVGGVNDYKGSVESVETAWYQSAAPLTSIARIKNSGQTDFDIAKKVVVSDLFGNVRFQEKNEGLTVLPETTRALTTSWDKPNWLGIYKVRSEITVLGNTTTKESFVLVAPVWFVVLIIILLGAGVFYALRGRKARR